jgi:uncharacterized protein (DUF2236 family)
MPSTSFSRTTERHRIQASASPNRLEEAAALVEQRWFDESLFARFAVTGQDGLFGPDSVTWRAMAHPATGIGAAAAAMIQMLYPPVMYVVDQASSFRERPDLRAQRTSDYATTITYGDVAAAEAAGESLRRIHARCVAVHPDSGDRLVADEPHLLVWVHNALTWALLRAWSIYGPELTPAERDRFVTEQKVSARLVGCDVDAAGSSVADLEAYMASMESRLAMSAPCVWFKEMMTERPKEGGVPAAVGKHLMVQASVAVMGEHHRALWGFPWGPRRERLVVSASRAVLGAAASKLPLDRTVGQLREHVDAHAFGSRRTRSVTPPAAEPAA